MWNRLWSEIAAEHRVVPPPAECVSEAELAALPPAARAYLGFYRVVPGAAKRWSFVVGWTGKFRLGPERPWMPIEAVQFDTREPVARFFHVRARMAHVLPVRARDTYLAGRGHMVGKIAGLVTIVDATGIELDLGELVTWVNDAVLLAPTLLLSPRTEWRDAGERAFELSITDRDRTVSARVGIDERGAPVDFETRDRFMDDRHGGFIRALWTTSVDRWQEVAGQPAPASVRAVWHLPAGDFCYGVFELVPGTFAYDVAPPATVHAA